MSNLLPGTRITTTKSLPNREGDGTVPAGTPGTILSSRDKETGAHLIALDGYDTDEIHHSHVAPSD